MPARRDGRFCPAAVVLCRRALCALALLATTWGSDALASPGAEGTRNLSMGNGARGSASGTNAAMINPSHMSFQQQFAIEPMYQLRIQNLTHGIGLVVMDSLNNARFALGLGYLFTRGSPEIEYIDESDNDQSLELSHFGHEVLGAISIVPVKRWLALAVKPKYQYVSLRYLDPDGEAHNANKKLNAFGLDVSVSLNLLGWAQIGVVGYNLVGPLDPAFTRESELDLPGLDPINPATFNRRFTSRLSDYPRSLGHGLAVYPLNHPDLSLNFDGTYDFTSYWTCETDAPCDDLDDAGETVKLDKAKFVRKTFGGSIEYVLKGIPLRLGSYWDSRGKGGDDDRTYVTGGIGYIRPPKPGGVGVDAGFGFSQQVDGPQLETVIGVNVGLRIHPDL